MLEPIEIFCKGNYLEQMENDEITIIKELLLPLFKTRQSKKVILFGSYAKGCHSKKSDLDLLIITETEKLFLIGMKIMK
jgi:predicted nucleotidyltransferase